MRVQLVVVTRSLHLQKSMGIYVAVKTLSSPNLSRTPQHAFMASNVYAAKPKKEKEEEEATTLPQSVQNYNNCLN